MDRQRLGLDGEDVAARYLQSKGYEIVERRWRSKLGEIDLVCRFGDEAVFVEVKTRRTGAYGFPEEAVTAAKQAKLRALAWSYARLHRIVRYRVDVIAIFSGPEATRLRHFENVVSGF